MPNSRAEDSPKPTSFNQLNPSQEKSLSTFTEDEIRVRAYQIYESRERSGAQATEDWSQAETELMELLGGQ
jgi:hypothetical protein